MNNCTRVQITKSQHLIRVNNTNGQSKQLEIAHLNAESLKCRQHFHEVKEMALDKKFDILTISETWFNSTVTNESVEIDGYQIYRLDRLGKAGAVVCAYVKNGFKANVLKDLSAIGKSGLHQLWIQIQRKKHRSILLCVIYRPPDIGHSCLQEELLPKCVQALSLKKDIVLMGDANCDLLTKNPKGEALSAFCAFVNATQLIDEPTKVTKTTRSLLVVVIVSNQGVVKSSGVLQLTISDHFLVYVKFNLKTPRQAPNNITTRSFRHYKANHFASDVAHIPWGSVDLKNTVEEQLDAFNDLFVTCLHQHAPIKTLTLRRRPNPVINEEIKDLITSRNDLLKKYRKSGSLCDWNAFQDLRREIKLKIRQVERDYYNEKMTANKGNTGAVWKTIRSALSNKSRQRPSILRTLTPLQTS